MYGRTLLIIPVVFFVFFFFGGGGGARSQTYLLGCFLADSSDYS
jgi:hypothetical protein